MTMGARRVVVLCTAAVTFSSTLTMSSVAFAGTPSGVASARAVAGITWDTAREVSETTRLADRRSLTSGDRMYVMGDESGLYPAAGWHIRGEMGGFWTPPVKLLDGVWFRIADNWLGAQIPTTQYTRGFGYERYRFQQLGGLSVERVNLVPDGARAAVIGLTLRSNSPRTVPIAMDAHSELLPAYPWGWWWSKRQNARVR